MAIKWMIAVLVLTLTGLVQSSHFRGGIIQWRPLNAQNFDGRVCHMQHCNFLSPLTYILPLQTTISQGTIGMQTYDTVI